jgi:site-specific DNA recombinase
MLLNSRKHWRTGMTGNDNKPVIPVRAALYARVSTDDQRERQTIQSQVTALRNSAPHWNMTIVSEYLDDGISGTVAMEKRPEGARLVRDAKDGKIDVVIFYRLDRLARSLRNFLDLVDFFEDAEVGLRSMTETFDTTNPMGRFAIQMIAAVAELERGTILERTSMGRARIAAQGRWTGGVVPYGYLVDGEGYLVVDRTPRHGCPYSEAEIIERIYRMIADDQGTAMAVSRSLNQEGVPRWRKYHPKGQKEARYKTSGSGFWWHADIARIIRAETYKGSHTWGSGEKQIVRDIPPIVDRDTWERAQRQLTNNKRLSKRGQDHAYLLRGLIRCKGCGKMYAGAQTAVPSRGWSRLYYRCGSQAGARNPWQPRCNGKLIGTDWLEGLVWKDIETFLSNPGDVINRLQERIQADLEPVAGANARKRDLELAMGAKQNEHDRVLDGYRRGLFDIDELEVLITRSRGELEALREKLAGINLTETERGQSRSNLSDVESLLVELRDKVQGPLDWETRRQIVEALVSGIRASTTGEGRNKEASIEVTYAFEAPSHAVEHGIA